MYNTVNLSTNQAHLHPYMSLMYSVHPAYGKSISQSWAFPPKIHAPMLLVHPACDFHFSHLVTISLSLISGIQFPTEPQNMAPKRAEYYGKLFYDKTDQVITELIGMPCKIDNTYISRLSNYSPSSGSGLTILAIGVV